MVGEGGGPGDAVEAGEYGDDDDGAAVVVAVAAVVGVGVAELAVAVAEHPALEWESDGTATRAPRGVGALNRFWQRSALSPVDSPSEPARQLARLLPPHPLPPLLYYLPQSWQSLPSSSSACYFRSRLPLLPHQEQDY